jgi:hypothetical protein
MREIMTIVEASMKPRMRPTAKTVERIRRIRHECRRDEGGGGMCHRVSEWIEADYGWPQASGAYCAPNGECAIEAHYWNILPDGAILDSTADQVGEGKDVEIITPSDPAFARYRPEWDDEFNPSKDYYPHDRYPDHREQWNGETDWDQVIRLNKERGHYWWSTHPEQLAKYCADRKKYEDEYEAKLKGK